MVNYRNKEVKLIDVNTGNEVNIGDKLVDFRGGESEARYFEPPHKASSSGKVNGYYASVYGLKYVEIN